MTRSITVPVGDGAEYLAFPPSTEVFVARRALTNSGVPIYHFSPWEAPGRPAVHDARLDPVTEKVTETDYLVACGWAYATWQSKGSRDIERGIRIRLEFIAGGGTPCQRCIRAITSREE